MARRDTRELILQTSLELFNHYGEPNVTTNQIADEADISPGNLYYHFRSKDDLVIELFKRFLARFQPLIEVPENVALHPEDLWFQLHLGFELKGEFRFLYRNLADLAGRIPDFDRAMRGLLRREREAAGRLLDGLQKSGATDIEPAHREMLCDNILLGVTYWIPFADLLDPGGLDDARAQTAAIARILLMLTPWLRRPERDQFLELASEYLARSGSVV